MKMLTGYLRPYLGRMSLGLGIKFAGSVMDLLLPWILAHLIDTVAPQGRVPQILKWGGVMLGCALFAYVTNILANRMASRVARNAAQALRHDLFQRTLHLSAAQVDRLSIPTLEARLTTDTYHVHQMIGMMQRLGVRAPILLIGGICVTLTLEPVLSLVMIATLPWIALVILRISRRGIPLYEALQQAIDHMVRVVRENIAGIRVIKALSKTDHEKRRFAGASAGVVDAEQTAGFTMARTNPLMNGLLNLGLALVILVGAVRVNAGLSQPGKIIAFLSYFTIISTAMLSITRMFVIGSRGIASAGRIREVLELPQDLVVQQLQNQQGMDLPACTPEPGPPALVASLDAKPSAKKAYDGNIVQPLPRASQAPSVVFDGVSFSYVKRVDNLHGVSFSLGGGQTLGVIGPTGSGKSTLVQLLMRRYDPDRGEIRIGGRPLRSIDPSDLHTRFGVVFQHDALFAQTIAENIDFGRGLSSQAIEQAARDAQAAPFIEALPDRYDHRLTAHGTNLSGGQKQRLLIARALAARPGFLVLDDATSALDYGTEARLRAALRRGYQEATKVIVAQRVSSIRDADLILMLAGGRVIGQGDHATLMETCPAYRETYLLQTGGEPFDQAAPQPQG